MAAVTSCENTVVSIWRVNIFFRGHYLFRETNSFPRAYPARGKNLSFEEQIMSKDKYPSIFFTPNGGYRVIIALDVLSLT